MNDNYDEIEIDLREVFNRLWSYKFLIAAVTIICAALSLAYTIFFIPEKYQSNATLIVNSRQDQTVNVTNDQINSAKQLVDTYAVILKSDTVLDNVIDNLNLTQVPGLEDIDAAALSKMVTISQVDSTMVMKVSAVTTSKELSTDIVTEIVDMAPEMIINTVKAGSVEIISAPKAQEKKVAPSLKKNVALAAFVGLFISAGLVVLTGLLDRTFKSDEDITKYLGIPVLGVIPDIEK